MRRTWKRTLGAYLLALALSLLPAAAWAADDPPRRSGQPYPHVRGRGRTEEYPDLDHHLHPRSEHGYDRL